MTNLKHPDMRYELIETLKDLADKEKQIKEWCDPKYKYAFWSNLNLEVAFLYDSLWLDKDGAREQIGYCLYNENEAQVVDNVIIKLDQVLDRIDMKQPDAAYINSPLWDEVIKAAGEAYDVLTSSEPKSGLSKDST